MKAVLVFIDGTICDTRPRHPLGIVIGSPESYQRDVLLMGEAVPDSVQCMQEIAQRYELVYMGARPDYTLPYTEEWLALKGFPKGHVYVKRTQEERLELVRKLRDQFDFAAGIGDRWDDNELHLEMRCLSIILKEFEGNWNTVRKYLLDGDKA